jgi:hypothetical protein
MKLLFLKKMNENWFFINLYLLLPVLHMTIFKRSAMALPQAIFAHLQRGNTKLLAFAGDVNLMGRDINAIKLR